MKTLLLSYLLMMLATAVYETIRMRRQMANFSIKTTINGELFASKLVMFFGIGFVVAQNTLLWPRTAYRNLKLAFRTEREEREDREHEEALLREGGTVELQMDRHSLPLGDEYVRQVKQVHTILHADFSRALTREAGHKLVVADVLLELAYRAIAVELGSEEAAAAYFDEAAFRVVDGREVASALDGVGRVGEKLGVGEPDVPR